MLEFALAARTNPRRRDDELGAATATSVYGLLTTRIGPDVTAANRSV
jgi:hypothetical protein